LRVIDVQAAQEGVGGIAGAGQVIAVELDLVRGQRLQLRRDVVRSDTFRHDATWQVSCVRCERRNAEGGGAETGQGDDHRGREAAGVALDESSGALDGGGHGAVNRVQRTQFGFPGLAARLAASRQAARDG
jgi:hypothetical protein